MIQKHTRNAFGTILGIKSKTKTGIAPLLEDPNDKDSLKYGDKEKSEILQKQYLSVFKQESNEEIPIIPQKTNKIIENIIIEEDKVKHLLQKLDVNKSLGPDKIHPRILAELAEFLAGPVTLIFRKSIKEASLPREWK